MDTKHRRLALGALVWTIVLLAPQLVFADNCSSLTDCFSTMGAAAAAAAAAGVTAAASGPANKKKQLDPCKLADAWLYMAIALAALAIIIGAILAYFALSSGPASPVVGLVGILFLLFLIGLAAFAFNQYLKYKAQCIGIG